MRVARLTIKHFRGFDAIEVAPKGHVLLVGEPRAGRTDMLTALGLALAVDGPRNVGEFDFHQRDLTAPIEIEVVLADLSPDLVQRFLEHLDFWDTSTRTLVEAADDPSLIPGTAVPAVRLAFHGRWDAAENSVQQVRFWPKASDPPADLFRRVSRDDRAALPFAALSGGKPLNLAPQGDFREFLAEADPDALAAALDDLMVGMEGLSRDLGTSPVVSSGLSSVFSPLWSHLRVAAPGTDSVMFMPDGGGLAALLRSLLPTVDLADGAGHMPLRRHGSTTSGLVSTAEAVASGAAHRGIVAIDDFGDTLDTAGAERLSGLLRGSVGQVWLSTRRPETARAFEPEDLVRLSRPRPAPGQRTVSYGSEPQSRAERVVARELHRQVLPAMSAGAVIVVEGPHDLSAYSALADRLMLYPDYVPAAHGARLIDAGGNNGGIDQSARVCALARQLGFQVVALVDWDHDLAAAQARLTALLDSAHHVVRLPYGSAIEQALLGVPPDKLVDALSELNATFGLPLPAGWQTLDAASLADAAAKALKSNNGIHAEFVHTLAPDGLPPVACLALQHAVACARGDAQPPHVQL